MHDTAYYFGKLFYDVYVPKGQNVQIVEIGSQNVNGGLREIFTTPYTNFVGLDFVPGNGVDKVLENPYVLPYNDNTCDIVLCSSVLEHSEMFWVLFLEIVRVLRRGGLFYLNVPSNGDFHRWPVDCWRFYPDSGRALQKWAQYNNYEFNLLESFIGNQANDIWNDFVAVFCKGPPLHDYRIIDNITGFTNGLKYGKDEFINYDPVPQDRKK